MGVVYLVYDHKLDEFRALKTFRDEYWEDPRSRDGFERECLAWVQVGAHPFIVPAYYVDHHAGRRYLAMEFIVPDYRGRNNLHQYLSGKLLHPQRALCWAIQICLGMEHACARGITAHRDLKPQNVMVAADRTAKITDFGLAKSAVLSQQDALTPSGAGVIPRLSLVATQAGVALGTPGYMSPEQWDDACRADRRSDIYSFGVILYQMATGGRLPFLVRHFQDWRDFRRQEQSLQVQSLDSVDCLWWSVTARCLSAEASRRPADFAEVRAELEALLRDRFAAPVKVPRQQEENCATLNNRGACLANLGRHDEAIHFYEQSLQLDRQRVETLANMGLSHLCMKRYEVAITWFDRALAADPQWASAWEKKATALDLLSRPTEALQCYRRAMEIDPEYAHGWYEMGVCLESLDRYDEATASYERALEIEPENPVCWCGKGNSLAKADRIDEALVCFNHASKLDPCLTDALDARGTLLLDHKLGTVEEALQCFECVLQIDPRHKNAWHQKGVILAQLGKREEALRCLQQVLQLDPADVEAWISNGNLLHELERFEEALSCYREALQVDCSSEVRAMALTNMGNSLVQLGRTREARACYKESVKAHPQDASAWFHMGHFLEDAEEFEEAVRCYRKAAELDPEYPEPLVNLAHLLTLLDCCEEAVACCDQLLAVYPNDIRPLCNKALALERAGRFQDAVACYRRIVAIEPVQVLGLIPKIQELIEGGRHNDAVEIIQVLANCPSLEQHLASLGAPSQLVSKLLSLLKEQTGHAE